MMASLEWLKRMIETLPNDGGEAVIRIEPRNTNSAVFSYGVFILSAFVARSASIPLWLVGAPVLLSYVEMAKGVFGSKFAFSEMLTRATPLMFTVWQLHWLIELNFGISLQRGNYILARWQLLRLERVL